VLAILDTLAEDPAQSLTAAEIGRRLGITNATCHAILARLVHHGYVVRNLQSKRYRLGPRLLTIGRAAQEALSPLLIATSELQRLSDDTQLKCSLRTVSDDSVIVLAYFGGPARLRFQPGTSYPFSPPFGFSFAIWGGDDALRDWIARAPVRPRPREITRLKRLAEVTRTRGYLVHQLGGAEREALYAVMASRHAGSSGPVTPTMQALVDEALHGDWVNTYLLEDTAATKVLDVSGLSAPIFDPEGRVAFVVEVHLEVPRLTFSGVRTLGQRLVATVREITLTAGGLDPTGARPARTARRRPT
jgi:DNA-binding IclR family transcriptional regulator